MVTKSEGKAVRAELQVPSKAPREITVAARLERQLALSILRGERVAGSVLPPVRTLAATFGVTPPTIQRVVDRLETSGLVVARRGSGVTVRDPRRSADLSLLPLWFEAFADQPERAASILGDFLEVRRVLGRHMVMTARADLAALPSLVPLFSAALAAESVEEIAVADAELTFTLVEASGQFAVSTILQLTSRLVHDVPHLAEAFFGDRDYYRSMLQAIAFALAGSSRDEVAAEVDRIFLGWDERTIRRYRAALAGGSG
jgi:DNA-binding FadR family transcriptional regulator